MRLFVSIELPAEIKGRLQAWLGEPRARDWRWTAPPQWHITLVFLGEVAEDRVEALEKALADAPFETFSLALGTPGGFPNERRATVAWIGLIGDLGKLAKLRQAAFSACRPFAPQMDSKPFNGHITIGRSQRDYGLALPFPRSAPSGHWKCDEFRLMKSYTRGGSVVHEVVQTYRAQVAEPQNVDRS